MTHSNHIAFFLLVILVAVLTVPNTTCAQNLVPNPSFELYGDCPVDGSFDELYLWYSPSWSSPDYFNSCSEGSFGLPESIYGELQVIGNGMIGLLSIIDNESAYREYAAVRLLEPLEGGVEYCFSAQLLAPDSANVLVSSLGVYVDADSIYQATNSTMSADFDLVMSSGEQLISTGGFTEFQGQFIAEGGEQFVCIGNPLSDEETLSEWNPDSQAQWGGGYCCLDQVVLEACSVGVDVTLKANPFDIESGFLKLFIPLQVRGYGISGRLLFESEMQAGNYRLTDFFEVNKQIILTLSTGGQTFTQKLVIR